MRLVHYQDIDNAIHNCLTLKKSASVQGLFLSKSDLTSAFRIMPAIPDQWNWMIMQATHPVTGEVKYFVEKCLPFGASSSCYIFQHFSNALRHLIEDFGKRYQVMNYLDDFLFVETTRERGNRFVTQFIILCEEIRCPVSIEKTEWAEQRMIFLGILLDVENFVLAIPIEKHNKALFQICLAIANRKLMVKQIQQLTGILNFLNRALILGRAFTQRMYVKLTRLKTVAQNKRQLKHYHHANLDSEFLQDCKMWEVFLTHSEEKILCCPFLDILGDKSAEVLRFYSDASGSSSKGFGCFYDGRWTFGLWESLS